MSRLQVGGLALVVNDTEHENIGKVVKLVAKRDDMPRGYFSMAKLHDCWEVYCEDGLHFPDGIVRFMNGLTSSMNLIPLGDKQTQDELAKEKELEHT